MPIINQLSIATAFCLPAPDIAALTQGRTILVMPRIFTNPGRQFLLYPTKTDFNALSIEQYYRPSFLATAKQSVTELNSEEITLKVWAKCELCQIINEPENFENLSKLTAWTEEALYKTLEQRGSIFLAYLRVYELPEPVRMSPVNNARFVSLPHPVAVTEAHPLLDDYQFEKQYRKILNRQPPEHPEIEELENAIAQFQTNNLSEEEQRGLNSLKANIHQFLGWKTSQPEPLNDSSLNWIHEIAALGNRSLEQEQNKSNYQAGTDFENIVKKSLKFLGFDLDPNAQGGAGGMDLYCIKPYPMVGECKAGRSIPDSTAEQLYRIGLRHLGRETYEQATKLIIGPGQPTSYLKQSAQNSTITIIHPMTLEKLVKLQAKYPGSVDLIKLKEYLQAGQSDAKIEEYIEKVTQELRLRSHIIQLIKKLNQNISLEYLMGAYSLSHPPKELQRQQLEEILIELSSPLTGYLGRTTDNRFYFLRDLRVD